MQTETTPISAISHVGFVLVTSSLAGLIFMLATGVILSKKTSLSPKDRTFAAKAVGTIIAVVLLLSRI